MEGQNFPLDEQFSANNKEVGYEPPTVEYIIFTTYLDKSVLQGNLFMLHKVMQCNIQSFVKIKSVLMS